MDSSIAKSGGCGNRKKVADKIYVCRIEIRNVLINSCAQCYDWYFQKIS